MAAIFADDMTTKTMIADEIRDLIMIDAKKTFGDVVFYKFISEEDVKSDATLKASKDYMKQFIKVSTGLDDVSMRSWAPSGLANSQLRFWCSGCKNSKDVK